METNQGELAWPHIMRYNIGDKDIGFVSENRKPSNTVRNIVTEAPSSANSQILPPKQAEVFGSPAKCYSIMTVNAEASERL